MWRKFFLLIIVFILTIYVQGCNKVKSFVVTFDSQGGTYIEHIEIKGGETLTYTEPFIKLIKPIKEGYTFLGWYTDQDYQNEFSLDSPITQDLKLFAYWNINEYIINLNFNVNGILLKKDEFIYYIEHDISLTRIYGEKIDLPSDFQSKNGEKFVGWFEDDKLTKEFLDNEMPARNLTLFAKWEK